MMRNPTKEELELEKKLYESDISEEEKNTIVKRLKEIDEEETKGWPFCH